MFSGCTNKTINWSIEDNHSVITKQHEIQNWIERAQLELNDLKPIMTDQIGYYIDSDFRMVERIEPHYESMIEIQQSITELKLNYDSLFHIMSSEQLTIDSIDNTNDKSFKKNFLTQNKFIQKNINLYNKSKKKLIKGFRRDEKELLFVLDYIEPWGKELYDLQLKRKGLNPELEKFNSILNEILFLDDKSFYSRKIKKISKKIEKVERDLNKYESFLSLIEKLALKETKSRVVLDFGDLKVESYYREGKENYLSQLQQIRNWIESI